MRWTGILALAIGWIAASCPAPAQDLVFSRTLVEDRSGTLTLGDVIGQAGTKIGPDWNVRSTNWIYWIRVSVHAPAHGGKVVLFIRPSYLNEVRLFEPDAGSPSGWRTRVTGNVYPFSGRDRSAVSLGFVVNVPAPEQTYYLRVKTRSRVSLQVEGLEPGQADRKDHQRDLLEVFFITSMGFLLIWAIHAFHLDRQPVVGWFAVHQAAYTLFGVAATGYMAPLNPAKFPHLVDWINATLYLGINFTCAMFCCALFGRYDPPPLVRRVLDLLPWVFPVLLAALAAGYDSLAVNISAAILKLSLVFFFFAALSLRREHVPSRRVLQAFFFTILVYNLLFWYATRFTELEWSYNLRAIHALVFDGLVFGALFAWVLHSSSRQALSEANQAATQLLLVQKRFELEQELKKQLEIQARTDDLTGLCNRRHFFEQAEKELARSIRYGRSLVLMVIDIDHFKQVNDAWGHEAGDMVLQSVSKLIHAALRSNDILARYGGEEFAVLLPETGEDAALSVAERICCTVAGTGIPLAAPEKVRVSVSIGLAGMDENNRSVNALISEADRAMYRAKESGRNCARLSEKIRPSKTGPQHV
jgi:diguanylate cyclase (GGDEF)-like protein